MVHDKGSVTGHGRIDYMPAVALAIVVVLTGSAWVPGLLRRVWPAALDRIAGWPEPARTLGFGGPALVLVVALLAGIDATSLWRQRRKR